MAIGAPHSHSRPALLYILAINSVWFRSIPCFSFFFFLLLRRSNVYYFWAQISEFKLEMYWFMRQLWGFIEICLHFYQFRAERIVSLFSAVLIYISSLSFCGILSWWGRNALFKSTRDSCYIYYDHFFFSFLVMWIKEIFVSDGKVGEQMDHHSRNMKSDDTFFFYVSNARSVLFWKRWECRKSPSMPWEVTDTMKQLTDYYYYTRLFFFSYFFFLFKWKLERFMCRPFRFMGF